jgi:hypothetical protein
LEQCMQYAAEQGPTKACSCRCNGMDEQTCPEIHFVASVSETAWTSHRRLWKDTLLRTITHEIYRGACALAMFRVTFLRGTIGKAEAGPLPRHLSIDLGQGACRGPTRRLILFSASLWQLSATSIITRSLLPQSDRERPGNSCFMLFISSIVIEFLRLQMTTARCRLLQYPNPAMAWSDASHFHLYSS